MDMNRNARMFLGVILAVGMLPGVASADKIMSFAYNALNGAYVESDITSGQFTASACTGVTVPGGSLTTWGSVTRHAPVTGTAQFHTGFYDGVGGNSADFLIDIDVFNVGSVTAEGAGDITITDADGDTITGKLAGTWYKASTLEVYPGYFIDFPTRFEGSLYDVYLSGSEFNGTDGGEFSTDFSAQYGPEPYDGFVVSLSGDMWFEGDFSAQNTSASGKAFANQIPAPGALLLGAIGLGLAARKRR